MQKTFILFSLIFNSLLLNAQSCANYNVSRTTAVPYISIAGTSPSYFTWRNTTSNQNDDNRSYPEPIGFDFWYLGVRYTQFSGNLNGTIDFSTSSSDGNNGGTGPYGPNYNNIFSTANETMLALAPMYEDLWTAGGGATPVATSIYFQTSGSAPNRVLTVEWTNFDKWTSSTGSVNFQIKLYENTGTIEFVYGTMTPGTAAYAYTCGINGDWTSGSPTAAVLLSQQTANTTDFSNSPGNNLSTLPESNTKLTFTPPTINAAPTSLSFTNILQIGMKLHWIDNATGEVGYAIYNSTDNITFNFVTQTAANATSAVVAGLFPGTTYYWQVFAVSEGDVSSALTGIQSTNPPPIVTSIANGNWSETTTWDCACVPDLSDDITIADNTVVSIDMDASADILRVGQEGISGSLIIGNNASARRLAVTTNMFIHTAASFTTGATNATHQMIIGGDILNNGTLDLAPSASRVCNVTFNKNGNQHLSGTGAISSFNRITLDMGNSIANVFDITSTNFTVASANSLSLLNGTFKLSTPAALTLFSGDVTIPLSSGIWLNNTAATISTTGGTLTLLGSIKVTAGVFNIGNAMDNNLIFNGGSLQIDGGAMNIAGRLDKLGITALTNFKMSSGTITLATVGSTGGSPSFNIDEIGSNFTMSGGTIIIRSPGAGNLAYVNTGGTNGIVSAGTLQIGDAFTHAGETFQINSPIAIPNLVISNGIAVTAVLVNNPLTVLGNVTINAGILTGNNLNITLSGNWTNNGTFTPGTGTTSFINNSNSSISGSSDINFYNLRINKSSSTGYVSFSNNVNVTNQLELINGIVRLSTFTLKEAGPITRTTGFIDCSAGAIEMTGSSSQTIPSNTFQNNAVNSLIISNSSAAGVTLGGTIDIYTSLTYSGSGMKLSTNDSLTIKSTALNTAYVGDMTGNSITGQVTVERYLGARKAWRLLSVPTNSSQSIKQAWQESATTTGSNPVAGHGTQITSNRSSWATDGFDLYSPGGPSMKTYDPTTNNFIGIPATSDGIKNNSGYFVFVRGDRTANAYNSSPTQTILRSKGPLYTYDQAPITLAANKFVSIGNPYASAIDMRFINKSGLKDFFYVWDPKIGGAYGYGAYQTFSNNGFGDYIVTPGDGSYGPGGTIYNYIESGLAFLVQAGATGGTLTFKESAKSTDDGPVAMRAQRSTQALLRTNLYGINADGSTYMADGLLINYDDIYSNAVDDLDAIKSTNASENLSVKNGNTLLVIERRHTILQDDTIFLKLANTKAQHYRFVFTANNLSQPGLTGFLEDQYLHTRTPLNIEGSTPVDFSVVNVAGSYATDRFRIVFRQQGTLPVTFTSIKAYKQDKNINVEWKVENELNMKQYEVEKSVNGTDYIILAVTTPAAKYSTSASYMIADTKPVIGYNYYRIRSTDVNGKISYSTIVKLLAEGNTPLIAVYPNPVTNATINLQFNNFAEGYYGVRLLNKTGQVILSTHIHHTRSSTAESIHLDKYIAHGIYQLEITSPDLQSETIEVDIANDLQ